MILNRSPLGSPLSVVDYTTPSRRTTGAPPDALPRDPRARLPAWADSQRRAGHEVQPHRQGRRDAAYWTQAAQDWARAASELGTVSSEGSDRMLGYALACRERARVVDRYVWACRLARHRVALTIRGRHSSLHFGNVYFSFMRAA